MNVTYNPINIYNPQNKKAHCSFGMRISKIGRQIDKVIATKASEPDSIMELRRMLEDYFKSPQSQEKLINEGFHEKVFLIDDKYVLKYRHNSKPNVGNFTFDPGFSYLLNGLKSYFGKVLMRFGDIKILRNVSSNSQHVPAGIPRRMIGNYPKDELIAYYNNIYLPIFANLPQRSFDRIAQDFSCLNKKGFGVYRMKFDTRNPNNIVLAGSSTLRIVDEIDDVIGINPNCTAGLLDVFLRKANTIMLAPKTSENKPLRSELFRKVILAGERYELPLISNPDYDNKVWAFVCDFGKDSEDIISFITSLRENVKNKKLRLEAVNDYLSK